MTNLDTSVQARRRGRGAFSKPEECFFYKRKCERCQLAARWPRAGPAIWTRNLKKDALLKSFLKKGCKAMALTQKP